MSNKLKTALDILDNARDLKDTLRQQGEAARLTSVIAGQLLVQFATLNETMEEIKEELTTMNARMASDNE